MAFEGTGLNGLSIGSAAFINNAATRGSAGTLYVDTLVSCATGKFTTLTGTSFTGTNVLGSTKVSGASGNFNTLTAVRHIVHSVSSFTTLGASANVSTTIRGELIFVSAAAKVSAGADSMKLDGTAGKWQVLRNNSGTALTLSAASSGKINNATAAYTVSASSAYTLVQFTATQATVFKQGAR